MGCMLDFASLGPGGEDDIRFTPDNTLLAEYVLMTKIWKASIASQSYDAFTCRIQIDPMFECLDIASAAEATQQLFGGACTTGTGTTGTTGTTGDGYVGAYDIAKLLWVQFESPPYHALPRTFSAIPTVNTRVGTTYRCSPSLPFTEEDATQIAQWNVAVSQDPCISGYDFVHNTTAQPPSPGYMPVVARSRRLSEGAHNPSEMQVKVTNWLKREHGSWVRYSIAGTQVVTEIFIGGLRFDPSRQARLSNAPVPVRSECTSSQPTPIDQCEPTDPFAMEVRFARRSRSAAHFAGVSAFGAFGSGMCASVLPGFGSTIALTGNTLAIRQDPPHTACPIDLVLWVPNDQYATSPTNTNRTSEWWLDFIHTEPRVCLLRGSSVAQLTGEGHILSRSTCKSEGYNEAMSSSPTFVITPVLVIFPFPMFVFFVPVFTLFVVWLCVIFSQK